MMKTATLAAALVLLGVWHAPAFAQTSQEERIRKLEQRIRTLENRVADQDKAAVKGAREAEKKQADKWFNKIEVGGTIELEFVHEDGFEGDATNDFDAATVELGISAQIHDWVGGEVVLAWNGDDEKVEVDTATVTIAPPDSMFSMTGGIQTMPFGTYETNLISDPLTLDIGEVGATGLQFAMAGKLFSASAFVFKGENERGGKDRISNFGFALGMAHEGDNFELGANAGYINDIAEAGAFQDSEDFDPSAGRAVGGAHASVLAKWGPVSLIGEYVTALKRFEGAELQFGGSEREPVGARPSAWSVEAAVEFEVMKRTVTGAMSYQSTGEALALGLPESRYLFGVSVGITDNVGVGVELALDRDYGEDDGGTGKSATALTVQLAAEF